MKITVTRRIVISGGKAVEETACAHEPRLAFVSPDAELHVAEEVARKLFNSLPGAPSPRKKNK